MFKRYSITALGCCLIASSLLNAQQSPPAPDAPQAVLPSNLSLPPTVSVAVPADGGEGGKVTALLAAKRWSELLRYADSAINADPRDAHALYWRGVANFQLRQPIQAVQSLRAAQLLGLDNAALHESLGLAYYDLNQFVLFEAQMKLAARTAPEDPAPAYYLGLYRLSIQSDVKGALTYFREAANLDRSDWKSQYQLGYCLELSGDPAGAREAYLTSIRLIEEKHQAYGWPYQGMARLAANSAPAEALAYARKAVDLEPMEAAHHLMLAKTFEQSGNLHAGIEQALIAAELQPNDAGVRYLLFRMYKRTGDAAAADAQLKRFQAINAVYGPE